MGCKVVIHQIKCWGVFFFFILPDKVLFIFRDAETP